MFASPHFMAGSYTYTSTVEDQVKLCGSTEYLNCSLTETVPKKMALSNYLYVMFFAHMLHGVGASPVFTLVVTFIDENTSKKDTPTYLGQSRESFIFLSFFILNYDFSVVLFILLRPISEAIFKMSSIKLFCRVSKICIVPVTWKSYLIRYICMQITDFISSSWQYQINGEVWLILTYYIMAMLKLQHSPSEKHRS